MAKLDEGFEEVPISSNLDEGFEEIKAPIRPEQSTLDDILRGAAQGATLGFRDELAGLVEGSASGAAKAAMGYTPEQDKDVADYMKARDYSRLLDQFAKESSPIAFTGGEILGSMALPVGGGANLVKGGVTGIAKAAGMGAIAGLGQSENLDEQALKEAAKGALLSGTVTSGLKDINKYKDLSDLLKTVAKTSAKGAAVGGLLEGEEGVEQGAKTGALLGLTGGLGKSLGTTVKESGIGETLSKAFSTAAKGKDFLSKEGRQALQEESRNISKQNIDELLKEIKAKGGEIETLLNPQTASKIKDPKVLKEIKESLKKLEPYGSAQEQQKRQLLELLSQREQRTSKTAQDTKNFLNVLRSYADKGDPNANISDKTLADLLKQATTVTKESLQEQVPGLQKVNKEYGNLKAALKNLGIDATDSDLANIEAGKLREKLLGSIKEGTAAERKFGDIEAGLNEALKETNPELAKTIISRSKDIAKESEIADNIEKLLALKPGSLQGTTRGVVSLAGASAGKLARPFSEVSKAISENKMVKPLTKVSSAISNLGLIDKTGLKPVKPSIMSSNYDNQNIDQIKASLNENDPDDMKLSEKLDQIKNSPEDTQRAQMFALSQHPVYGPLMRKYSHGR